MKNVVEKKKHLYGNAFANFKHLTNTLVFRFVVQLVILPSRYNVALCKYRLPAKNI